MRRSVGIFGATEESLRLIVLLTENPDLEIVAVWDSDLGSAKERALAIDSSLVDLLEEVSTDDVEVFAARDLHAVVASEGESDFRERVPGAAELDLQVLTPLTARLLWGYGVSPRDHKADLLQALNEIVESVDLAVDSDEIFTRMLEIAVGVTGAEGGSLMLLDEERRCLRIRIAIGVEPELWEKIAVPLGDGIAGKAAADARSIRLCGKADQTHFRIIRERFDVESALCVPLVHEGRVLGVLNLHHTTLADAFDEEDLAYVEQLAQLDSQLIARAQEHEALRDQAARYEAIRAVQGILTSPNHLAARLQALCQFVAARVGDGIATVYLHDPAELEMRLAATSMRGGGFGGEYRIVEGQGVDGRVANSRRPIFLRDDKGSTRYASLPLSVGEHFLGVLSIQAGSNPPRGRAAQETLLEIAAAVAEGVAQVEREARMAARATRVSAINETGIRMLSARETSEVARLATSSACMILEADHAVLRLQDEQTLRYVIRSYYGSADGRLQEKLFRLDKQISVEVLQRRTALLYRDLAATQSVAELRDAFRSAITAPIKREGRLIGTLSLYDKVAPDQFYAGRFNDEDLQIFGKLISYIERAFDNAAIQSLARQHRNFDDETGLPNETYLQHRIHQEIARATPRQGTLAVAVCRIENLDEIAAATNATHAHRVVLKTAEALRSHIRDFDVLGRSDRGEFTILMPDPGNAPAERVFELSRATADAVTKEEALNEPLRVALAFGHAIYPTDALDRDGLIERASTPRIKMV